MSKSSAPVFFTKAKLFFRDHFIRSRTGLAGTIGATSRASLTAQDGAIQSLISWRLVDEENNKSYFYRMREFSRFCKYPWLRKLSFFPRNLDCSTDPYHLLRKTFSITSLPIHLLVTSPMLRDPRKKLQPKWGNDPFFLVATYVAFFSWRLRISREIKSFWATQS